jgi:hypothetical protein
VKGIIFPAIMFPDIMGPDEASLCIFAMLSTRRRSSATSPDFAEKTTFIPSTESDTETAAPEMDIGQLCIMAVSIIPDLACAGGFCAAAQIVIVNIAAARAIALKLIFIMATSPVKVIRLLHFSLQK